MGSDKDVKSEGDWPQDAVWEMEVCPLCAALIALGLMAGRNGREWILWAGGVLGDSHVACECCGNTWPNTRYLAGLVLVDSGDVSDEKEKEKELYDVLQETARSLNRAARNWQEAQAWAILVDEDVREEKEKE